VVKNNKTCANCMQSIKSNELVELNSELTALFIDGSAPAYLLPL